MTTVTANDQKVELLPGVTLAAGGMFDHFLYRGIIIVMGESSDEFFTGPFGVGDDMDEVATLADAVKMIDAMVSA